MEKIAVVSDTGGLQRLVRARELRSLTGHSPQYIYELMAAGKFPKPIKLAGGRAVAWLESELVEWQQARIRARDAKAEKTAKKKAPASAN